MPEKSKVKCKIQKQKNKEKSREKILKGWGGGVVGACCNECKVIWLSHLLHKQQNHQGKLSENSLSLSFFLQLSLSHGGWPNVVFVILTYWANVRQPKASNWRTEKRENSERVRREGRAKRKRRRQRLRQADRRGAAATRTDRGVLART